MARPSKKSVGPPIGDKEWTTALTWLLLAEAEKSENKKTLLEKKDEVSLFLLHLDRKVALKKDGTRKHRRTPKLLSSSTLDLSSGL